MAERIRTRLEAVKFISTPMLLISALTVTFGWQHFSYLLFFLPILCLNLQLANLFKDLLDKLIELVASITSTIILATVFTLIIVPAKAVVRAKSPFETRKIRSKDDYLRPF